VIASDGERFGSLGSAEADAEAASVAGELLWTDVSTRRGDLFIDVVGPTPRLVLVGAVDIAGTLCTLAKVMSWRPYVIDPRARFATRDRLQDADDVLSVWLAQAFQQLGGIDPATSIIALTHDPKLDDAALIIALRSPAAFVGAMGSRRAQSKRRERCTMQVSALTSLIDSPPPWDWIWARVPRKRRHCRSSRKSWQPATGTEAGGCVPGTDASTQRSHELLLPSPAR
jgi:xanthine/CO dehydrogenase XdhC/CoxF family maturation factor